MYLYTFSFPLLLAELGSICRRIIELEAETYILRQRLASITPHGIEISDRPTNSILPIPLEANAIGDNLDDNPEQNPDATSTNSSHDAGPSNHLTERLTNGLNPPFTRTLNGMELASNFIGDLFTL